MPPRFPGGSSSAGRMADGVIKPMRVDTSLLQGISAANQRGKASSASLKSSGTTTLVLERAEVRGRRKETTKAVPGQNYAEILTGPRAGMYLNTGGGARDGEAFVLVKHDGREDHIYGTGKDRKVVSVGGGKPTDSAPTRTPSHADRRRRQGASAEKTKPSPAAPTPTSLNGDALGHVPQHQRQHARRRRLRARQARRAASTTSTAPARTARSSASRTPRQTRGDRPTRPTTTTKTADRRRRRPTTRRPPPGRSSTNSTS